MIERIRTDLQRDSFGRHGAPVWIVGETAFEGNRIVEVDPTTAIEQVVVVKKTDVIIDKSTGLGRDAIGFTAPYDSEIKTGSIIRRAGLLFRVLQAAPMEAFGDVVCLAGSALQIDGVMVDPNHPDLTVLRLQVGYDSNLNPTGAVWAEVSAAEAHVHFVRGQTEYSGSLLLQTTEYVVVIKYVADIKEQDRVMIYGRPFKVDQINRTLLPGYLACQVSTDMR